MKPYSTWCNAVASQAINIKWVIRGNRWNWKQSFKFILNWKMPTDVLCQFNLLFLVCYSFNSPYAICFQSSIFSHQFISAANWAVSWMGIFRRLTNICLSRYHFNDSQRKWNTSYISTTLFALSAVTAERENSLNS